MATINTTRARINGVIDTTAPVLDNLNEIAFSAGAWMTWDPTLGKWSIVVNDSVSLSGARVFDDSNILGSINMTFGGVESMYNSVRVNYPHQDLRNARDEIYFTLAAGDRYFGEYDNELSIQTNLITDPIQAAYLGAREMKQSRIDAVVEFKTDYTAMDVEVGEVILLKNDIYNFNNGAGEYFRVIYIAEEDTEQGGIILSLTCIQYDGGVYSQAGLVREERNLNSGIVPAENNLCKIASDQEGVADAVADSLDDEAVKGNLTNDIFAYEHTSQLGVYEFSASITDQNFLDWTQGGGADLLNINPPSGSWTVPFTGYYLITVDLNWRAVFSYDVQGTIILPDHIRKRVRMATVVNGTTYYGTESTELSGDPLSDMVTLQLITLTQGHTVDFQVQIRSDLDNTVWTNAESIVKPLIKVRFYGEDGGVYANF